LVLPLTFLRMRLLLAALGLAAQQSRDEQVELLSASMADSLRISRYPDDLLTVGEAALAAARHAGNTPAEGKAMNNSASPTSTRDGSRAS
jgi:hypothetical protein